MDLLRTDADGFDNRVSRYEPPIASETQQQQVAMLRILLAVCQTALDAFQAADNPLDHEFVADLERIMERTRAELEAFASRNVKP